MVEYVLCYAESIDNPDIDWVVLIDKKNPSWQAGRLNLPGGRVEPGETPVRAAIRELAEGTGFEAELPMCEVIGTMHGPDWIVHVVLCPFKGPFKTIYYGNEPPMVVGLRQALEVGSRVLPELRTVIPLCIARTPWQMLISEDRNCFSYILRVGGR